MGKTETLGNGVKYVADLVAIREHYTFGTPEKCNKNLSSESQVQQYGCDLHDKTLLKVIPTEDTPHPRREAYRLMTILSPEIDASDDGVSEPEKNLLKRINYLREKKKKQYKEEGDVLHTTTVFSSLALLWNIVCCRDLEWRVTGTADGTDAMVCNNYQLLVFGVNSVNAKGVKQFRPIFFVLGPGEREEVFEIGLLAFLKYSRLLFGIENI